MLKTSIPHVVVASCDRTLHRGCPRAPWPEVPALWSTSLWGDVRRTSSGALPKRPRSGGGGGMTAGGLGPGDIMHDVVAKETELKRKLAAFASFNQTERDLLQTAFVRVGQEHRYGC